MKLKDPYNQQSVNKVGIFSANKLTKSKSCLIVILKFNHK